LLHLQVHRGSVMRESRTTLFWKTYNLLLLQDRLLVFRSTRTVAPATAPTHIDASAASFALAQPRSSQAPTGPAPWQPSVWQANWSHSTPKEVISLHHVRAIRVHPDEPTWFALVLKNPGFELNTGSESARWYKCNTREDLLTWLRAFQVRVLGNFFSFGLCEYITMYGLL
jgi:hypothetical protein